MTDDIIQKNHIEKELLSHLDGIKTVFDGSAGCDRFSIQVKNLLEKGKVELKIELPHFISVSINTCQFHMDK